MLAACVHQMTETRMCVQRNIKKKDSHNTDKGGRKMIKLEYGTWGHVDDG